MHLQYGHPSKKSNFSKIERIHRIALLKPTGCLNSTPTAALEVITNTIPIRLRLQELLATEYVRLLRKNDNHPLKVIALGEQHLLNSSNPQLVLPSQMMHCAIRSTAKRVDLSNIDKDPTYDPEMLCCRSFTRKALTPVDLGIANTRSKVQSNEAKAIADSYINQLNKNCLIRFTDGSALGNPGPCGAGAAIYIESISSTPVLLKRPVSAKSISYHGELSAIDLALEFCQPFFAAPTNINKIVILPDCQFAIETISSFQYPSNFTNILCKTYERVKLPSSKQIKIEILWIAAHTGIIGNELADKCAKTAAAEATESIFKNSTPLSYSEVKKEIKQNIIESWQRQWDRNEQSPTLHNIKPKVSTKSINHPQTR